VGEQLQEHVSRAVKEAVEEVERPLSEARNMRLNPDEKRIYDCLSKKPVHIDEVAARTRLMVGSTNAGLISLRLKGLIRQLPGSLFTRM